MVQLTQILSKHYPGWMKKHSRVAYLKKQSLFRLTYNQHGRSRNCYKLAINRFISNIRNEKKFIKKDVIFHRQLNSQRIYAACEDLGIPYPKFITNLPLLGVELDRKMLSAIAIWEPRTFSSLVEIVKKFDINSYDLK